MTYAEYLQSQGASPEEITTLVTATSERIFAAQQADLARANSAVTAYQNWFEKEAVPAYKKMEQDLTVTKANEARARTALLTLQERGLVNIAKDLGYEPDKPAASAGAPTTFDPAQYIKRDDFMQLANAEGDAIAAAYDIGREHATLFPDKPLNMRELRREALSRNIPVEQMWMEKYGVASARATRETQLRADSEEKLRKEGYEKARQEFADQYGNPSLRPPVPSSSPFTPRPNSGREKQPWEAGDRSGERVRRATQLVVERELGGTPSIARVQ